MTTWCINITEVLRHMQECISFFSTHLFGKKQSISVIHNFWFLKAERNVSFIKFLKSDTPAIPWLFLLRQVLSNCLNWSPRWMKKKQHCQVPPAFFLSYKKNEIFFVLEKIKRYTNFMKTNKRDATSAGAPEQSDTFYCMSLCCLLAILFAHCYW